MRVSKYLPVVCTSDLFRDNNTALRATLTLQQLNNNFLHNSELMNISVVTYFKSTACFHRNHDENHLQIKQMLLNRDIIKCPCCELGKFPT